MNYRYNFKNSTKFYFLRYFYFVYFIVTENASFQNSFQITIYLVIEQNH